jgi:MFS family permease
MKDKIFGVRKNVFFLGLVSFFNDFSSEMVQSVMPVFLTTVLGAPAFFVGFIEGVADALSSVFKLISGWMSDKIGKRKKPAVLGYSLSVFTRLFLTVVTNFWQVFFLRVIDRIGKGFRDSPRDALISESVPKEELGVSFGFHRAMDTLGATFGPLLGFLLIFLFKDGYRILFLVAFFLGLFAIGSFVFVKDQKIKTLETQAKKIKLDWNIFKEHKKFILVVGTLFVLGLGALPIGLVLLKAKEIGSLAQVPLMYFVYSATFVVVAVPIGKLADIIGEKIVIAFGFMLAALSYIALAFTSHILALTLFFIVLGIYSACTDGMQRMLAAKSLHGQLVATGQGFLNMAIGFSSLGAGIIGGLLWTFVNSRAAFLYAAILSLIGLILFSIVTKIKIEV